MKEPATRFSECTEDRSKSFSNTLVPIYNAAWQHLSEDYELNPLTDNPCHITTCWKFQGCFGANAIGRKSPQYFLRLPSNNNRYRLYESLSFPLNIVTSYLRKMQYQVINREPISLAMGNFSAPVQWNRLVAREGLIFVLWDP